MTDSDEDIVQNVPVSRPMAARPRPQVLALSSQSGVSLSIKPRTFAKRVVQTVNSVMIALLLAIFVYGAVHYRDESRIISLKSELAEWQAEPQDLDVYMSFSSYQIQMFRDSLAYLQSKWFDAEKENDYLKQDQTRYLSEFSRLEGDLRSCQR